MMLATDRTMIAAATRATARDRQQVNDDILLPADLPVAPVRHLLVHGSAAVAFAIPRLAQLIACGLGGEKIYLTGGLAVDAAEKNLAAFAVACGFPHFRKGETQAAYARRLLNRQLDSLGITAPEIVMEDGRGSGNTEENIRAAIRSSFMRHDDGTPVASVGIMGQAYHLRRAVGTVRRLAGEEAALDPKFAAAPVIIPHLVWPFGVTRHTWHLQADFISGPFYQERNRLTGTGNYYDKGFCHPVDAEDLRRQIAALPGSRPALHPYRTLNPIAHL